jgi:hypothetical protein
MFDGAAKNGSRTSPCSYPASTRQAWPGRPPAYDEATARTESAERRAATIQGAIATALRAEAADETGEWLVSVLLANATLDRPWTPAGPTAALRRTPGWQRARTEEPLSPSYVYCHRNERESRTNR